MCSNLIAFPRRRTSSTLERRVDLNIIKPIHRTASLLIGGKFLHNFHEQTECSSRVTVLSIIIMCWHNESRWGMKGKKAEKGFEVLSSIETRFSNRENETTRGLRTESVSLLLNVSKLQFPIFPATANWFIGNRALVAEKFTTSISRRFAERWKIK